MTAHPNPDQESERDDLKEEDPGVVEAHEGLSKGEVGNLKAENAQAESKKIRNPNLEIRKKLKTLNPNVPNQQQLFLTSSTRLVSNQLGHNQPTDVVDRHRELVSVI